MNWNRWIRQTHRWLSIAFTLVVIVNGIAVVRGQYTNRLGLMAVATLALQFFTGMYLFVLPYAARWLGGRGTE
jgi:heme A synthase